MEDKLEKKKIMDEVKEEIKRKQIEMKDLETRKRLEELEKKRHHQINNKKQYNK